MASIGSENVVTFRQAIVGRIFGLMVAGESLAVVAPASMGKSRLSRFLLRPDVHEHYGLPVELLVILVDCNRLAACTEWGLYELLLTSLVEACGRADAAAGLRDALNDLRRDVIREDSPLLARRHVELAVHMLCEEARLRLAFVIDEFDKCYATLPAEALANLRALRDAHKYVLSFALFLRDDPAHLRNPDDHEGFYELFSRAVLGSGPYGEADADELLAQIVERRGVSLDGAQRQAIVALSGGIPGLLTALADGKFAPDEPPTAAAAVAQPAVQEECRKIWQGLQPEERTALSRLAQGVAPAYANGQSLRLKGLIGGEQGRESFLSPVLREYALTYGDLGGGQLFLDESACVVWVEGRRIGDLTRLEFELLRFLAKRAGQVCSRDEILEVLYPDEHLDGDEEGNVNRVDSIVRRVRAKIEPVPKKPRYLRTAHGLGYTLSASGQG